MARGKSKRRRKEGEEYSLVRGHFFVVSKPRGEKSVSEELSCRFHELILHGWPSTKGGLDSENYALTSPSHRASRVTLGLEVCLDLSTAAGGREQIF
jgi:hypothetical protein